MSADRARRAIFGFCRSHGIDDDTRRAIGSRVVGKDSLTKMDAREMQIVLKALKDSVSGPRQARPARRRADASKRREVLPAGPHRSKLRALWICGYELGLIRDRTDEALATWICAQTGLDAAAWATPALTADCVEALKLWLTRAGGVCWAAYRFGGPPVDNPRGRVLEAQWRRLHSAGAVETGDHDALQAWVAARRGRPESYTSLNAGIQDRLIRELGGWLRTTTAGGGGRR